MLAVAALGAQPAAARAVPAQRMPLTQTNRTCGGAVIDGSEQTTSFGSVAVTRPASSKLVATVKLTGARPDTTYAVRLIQILPDDGDCSAVDGLLTTDSLGAGTTTVEQQLQPGAKRAWVALNSQSDFAHFYDSAPVGF